MAKGPQCICDILLLQVKCRWQELREDEKGEVSRIAYKDMADGEGQAVLGTRTWQMVRPYTMAGGEPL